MKIRCSRLLPVLGDLVPDIDFHCVLGAGAPTWLGDRFSHLHGVYARCLGYISLNFQRNRTTLGLFASAVAAAEYRQNVTN